MSIDPELAGEEFGYLTTTGRISGNPHEVEIWFAIEGDTIYLMNGDSTHPAGHADWVRNMRKQPRVSFRIAGRSFEGTGRIVADEGEDALARRILLAKYASPEKPLETWGRVAVPIAIELHTEAAS